MQIGCFLLWRKAFENLTPLMNKLIFILLLVALLTPTIAELAPNVDGISSTAKEDTYDAKTTSMTDESNSTENLVTVSNKKDIISGKDITSTSEDIETIDPLDINFRLVNGVVRISLNSSLGYLYQLEASDSLDSNWVSLNEEQIGNGSTIEFTDTRAMSTSHFYRVLKRGDR